MSRRTGRSLVLLMIILLISSLCMSSCNLIGLGLKDNDEYLTKDEVQNMINNNMGDNVTVEGGDNYDITINGVENDNVAAAKALLCSVSIRCVFRTVSYGMSYQPGASTGREKTSAGSGVIYKLDKNNGDAYILTNYHVVYYNQSDTENGISDNITVYLYGQESADYAIPATYVGGSMNYDLALLKVDGSRILAESNATEADLADSDEVAVLDRAIAVGNPAALGISATLGYINVESEYIRMEGADGATEIQIRVMRTDTAVNSGNSGGGLFNSEGKLIGIVNAKLNNTDNMGYAIPSNFVKSVAENILYYCDGTNLENVYRCYLGIVVSPSKLYTVYDEETGKVHKREQISVISTEKGGLAEGVLLEGDIINSITVDGVTYEVDKMYIVTDSMLSARVGSVVSIRVTRGNETLDLNIEITEKSLTLIK
ncbi:MAG: trypsin-like peptidase domain-containing protein [Clostridia bacterium]|nr:trypsin-like peptidase domain-containing protein [Clostridia bacterium]MBQ7390984.1 trypsin-like peptidase domain-containing protein [Clostridia bacterium]